MQRFICCLFCLSLAACSTFNPFGLTAEEERAIEAMSPAQKQQLLASIVEQQAARDDQNALAAQQRAYRQAQLNYELQQIETESNRSIASIRNSGARNNNSVTVRRVGDTLYYSDGTTARKVGDYYYFSNGATAHTVGDTLYYSD